LSLPTRFQGGGEVDGPRVGGVVIATGRSVCSTDPRLDGPAIWAAETRGERVSEWRIYEDTAANRRRLGLEA
jgi:hypothetical protein